MAIFPTIVLTAELDLGGVKLPLLLLLLLLELDGGHVTLNGDAAPDDF